MSNKIACSVIVPSYRSAATIGACLVSLASQVLAHDYEVIVVDSSPDDTPALVRANFPNVRLIHLPRQTDPAQARNIGARGARGSTLAFIDADCVAPVDWLARLHGWLQAGYHGAGGAICNGNSDSLVAWASYVCEFREFLPQGTARPVHNLTLGNAAYQREAFLAAGGFPAGYFPQEDQVFHQIFRGHGHRLLYDPAICVAHTHRAERGTFLRHQRFIGRSNARVVRRLNLPGAALARQGWLAGAALPGLVAVRFWRTVRACLPVEGGLLLRQPAILWLCWLGMWAWGLGFTEGAQAAATQEDVWRPA
jgi:glycosyltransferase involved in cell wall biosynthesis